MVKINQKMLLTNPYSREYKTLINKGLGVFLKPLLCIRNSIKRKFNIF